MGVIMLHNSNTSYMRYINEISRCFFHFFKIVVFWVVRRLGGGGKRAKWQKNFVLTLYRRNCTSYDRGFWYLCIKWWYLQQFLFHFFKILIFQVYQSSSINAKRSFWGVLHLRHMCVIFYIEQKQSFGSVPWKRCSYKFGKFNRKTPVLDSLF